MLGETSQTGGLAILWTNFGPYHIARIRALTRYFQVHAIQLAAFERLYSWVADRDDLAVEIHTLRQGAWEDQNSLMVAIDVWRCLNRLVPACVLVPGYANAPALAAAFWARSHRRASILMSESNAHDHKRYWLAEAAKRLIIKLLFDRAVVGGCRARDYLARLGMPQKLIGLGYNVVDNDFFSNNAPQPRANFLYVGRLATEKNIASLIEAFQIYRSQGGTWKLIIVGDGPLAQQLEVNAGPAITFAGHKTAKELIPYYASAGCFVLPSKREPWGLVVNEAMASGLPVIVSNTCGCVDDLVYKGENGFTFDPANSHQLAELLLFISELSDEERLRMSDKSREIISRYSPELFARAVCGLLND